MNTPALNTKRLILRRFEKKDIGDLYRILSDEEVNRFLPWFALENIEEARRFFEKRYAAKYALSQGYAYAICLKENDRPIGYVNVDADEPHDLGYGLCKEFWGRGIVTEAVKAVIAQAKEDGLTYITATHDKNNPRSGGVMRGVGMRYCYSYEEQWQPKDILSRSECTNSTSTATRAESIADIGTVRRRILSRPGCNAKGSDC